MPSHQESERRRGLGLCNMCGSRPRTIGIYCQRCKDTHLATRPRGADGELITHTVTRQLLGRKLKPDDTTEKIAKELGKSIEWVKTERKRLSAEFEAQSGTVVVEPLQEEITPQALIELKAMGFFRTKSGISFAAKKGNLDALAGFELVKEESEQLPYMLTELELAKKTVAAKFLCWACGKSLKGYVGRVGYEELEPLSKPEQLHYPAVAVTKKDGGVPTKEQANPGHKACNDMMASYRFDSAEQAKTKVVEQLTNRGIDFVAADAAEESWQITPAHYIEEKRTKRFTRKVTA